jgi:hypothetical protein
MDKQQLPLKRGTPLLPAGIPNGFGTAHAIPVEALVPLTVLIKRFWRPWSLIQADDLGSTAAHPIRDY